jgi:glycosyl hydrolase family 32
VLSSRTDWIWDSWIADDGDRFHLFFLKAPRALKDPRLRHEHARIGHASSLDLVAWDVYEDALGPAAEGFDDLALWTGSVARSGDGVWRMYYTALNSEGRAVRDQRIGLAESDDLMRWRRVAREPLVDPDPCWYTMLGDGSGASETWRDPFVFRAGDGWHMLITAREGGAERLRDGVLAHARSDDMVQWRLAPPLTEAAGFGQLEVAQIRQVDGQWLLVFTCHPEEQADPRPFSTWYVLADSPLGPFDLAAAKPFEDEPKLFAAPLVQRRDGSWAFVGFLNQEPEGIPSFEIVDPIGVELTAGTLRRSAAGP